MPVATWRRCPHFRKVDTGGLAVNKRRHFQKLAGQQKIVVPPHFPLDFPGTGSIAVHVAGPSGVAARLACGGASIAKGDADPEDEDDGQQATPQTSKERRKVRYRRGEPAGSRS